MILKNVVNEAISVFEKVSVSKQCSIHIETLILWWLIIPACKDNIAGSNKSSTYADRVKNV